MLEKEQRDFIIVLWPVFGVLLGEGVFKKLLIPNEEINVDSCLSRQAAKAL